MGRISAETGICFSYPMTTPMVRSWTVAIIQRGLRSGTILGYMSAIWTGHLLRGLEAPALADGVIKAALKGVKNRELLVDDRPRTVMTIELLSQGRAKLKLLQMLANWKRLIWTVMSFMFLGSELLATYRVKFDPLKSICGEDLKLTVVKAQGESVVTVQIRLKQPKMSRANPVQVVELPAIGGGSARSRLGRTGREVGRLTPKGASQFSLGETGRWSHWTT
jgi:hypothetical protein